MLTCKREKNILFYYLILSITFPYNEVITKERSVKFKVTVVNRSSKN